MDNGAEFWMTVPTGSDILDDRFSSNIEFPFRFEEIVRISLLGNVPNTSAHCNVDEVHDQLIDVDGIVLERDYGISLGGQPTANVLWLCARPT